MSAHANARWWEKKPERPEPQLMPESEKQQLLAAREAKLRRCVKLVVLYSQQAGALERAIARPELWSLGLATDQAVLRLDQEIAEVEA